MIATIDLYSLICKKQGLDVKLIFTLGLVMSILLPTAGAISLMISVMKIQ